MTTQFTPSSKPNTSNKESVEQCNICFDEETVRCKVVKTVCHHTFHTDCLKQLHKPECPLCREDITLNLTKLGLTEQETNKIVKRKKYQEFLTNMDMVYESAESQADIQNICLETNKLSEKSCEPYVNIFIDKIKNASKYFYKLYTKCNSLQTDDQGIFYYNFTSARDCISYLMAPEYKKSRLKWLNLTKARRSKKFKKNLSSFLELNTLSKPNVFYVCFLIENSLMTIIEFTMNAYKHSVPLSYHEIIQTLLYCDDKRCNCDRRDTSCQEYEYCKKLLKSKYTKTISHFVKKSFYRKDTEIRFPSTKQLRDIMNAIDEDTSSYSECSSEDESSDETSDEFDFDT